MITSSPLRVLSALLLLGLAACAGHGTRMPLVSATGAVYPPEARAKGVEGYVIVSYDVDADGRVQNARVVDSSPPGVFDESAVQAVSRWRFRPPQRDGRVQPVTGLRSRLDFAMGDGDAYPNY